ncbi:MAG: hypothetical protein JWO74_3143 [Solirubrobacterales bacterium]|jgi:hypothetical protein|nr:hypothetical protein [Solirubrobacterales bacterium]
MTYFLDVTPAGYGPDRIMRDYEMRMEADSEMDAIMAARKDPHILLITNARDWSKASRLRYPEDAGPRLACLRP